MAKNKSPDCACRESEHTRLTTVSGEPLNCSPTQAEATNFKARPSITRLRSRRFGLVWRSASWRARDRRFQRQVHVGAGRQVRHPQLVALVRADVQVIS